MRFRIVHVVVTSAFAGVERYVATTANELARRGCEVAVVGGSPLSMRSALGNDVAWLAGATPREALRSLARLGKQDVCHAHMTLAEATAMISRPVHRAPILATRHFAASRGSTTAARLLTPLISASLAREIATSHFVASRTERVPERVLAPGVPGSPNVWLSSGRVVLVLQRLEPEKDTFTALLAWTKARLWEEGWTLRVVGDGTQRATLQDWAAQNAVKNVKFVGWTSDVQSEFRSAGMLLAPTPAEGFGLGVVEAMAAGLPVVAAASGGHLETVGSLPAARMFPPHDSDAAASALRVMLDENLRAALSTAGRDLVRGRFSVSRHVDGLLAEYGDLATPKRFRPTLGTPELTELVVCSLEAWDDVWRRNQFFVDILLKRNPRLRVLFVEPPTDPLFDASQGRRPRRPRLRAIGYEGRLRAFLPIKLLPRRAGATADNLLRAQVRLAARRLGLICPMLWINDVTYAPMIRDTGWPSIYDVTDDWLVAPFSARELRRLAEMEQIALDDANEVVVCSESLRGTRGESRNVHLVPNAVDAERFRRPLPRPRDLPVGGRVAVYVGSLHESRLDVDLVSETAMRLPSIDFALVGPNALAPGSCRRLARRPNIHLLGARPHTAVPAYLQHADVLIIPHRVTPFTESLDPIKVYECLAVGKPTVSTPVAGFRDCEPAVTIASRPHFATAVEQALLSPETSGQAMALPTWEDRVDTIEEILAQIRTSRSGFGR